jgi:hypothetical protein
VRGRKLSLAQKSFSFVLQAGNLLFISLATLSNFSHSILQFLAQGREHMKTQLIEIVPYNPNWPKMFEKEAELIKHVLGKHCLEIHHIGSTAVPQLIASQNWIF